MTYKCYTILYHLLAINKCQIMGGKLKNKALPVFVRADDNQGAADATPAAAVTTKIGRNEDVNLHKQIQI